MEVQKFATLAHFFAYFVSHGYAPGTIAINVTWIEREFNACQTPRNMYPSIFNRFPVFQAASLKVSHFSTFLILAHFGLPWVQPCDNRGKCYMGEKRIQCLSNAPHHVPIYLELFQRYSEILIENCNFFKPALHLTPPYGVAPGTIAVNVTWIEREFNAYQKHRSMYPSISDRFPVIQAVSLKVRHFSTFLPPLGTPLGQSR